MTTLELEQVTRELLRDMYNAEYTGRVMVRKLDPVGYEVCLGLLTPDTPKVIYGELEDEAFLKFLEKELRLCRFNLINYGLILTEYPVPSKELDSRCGCNK